MSCLEVPGGGGHSSLLLNTFKVKKSFFFKFSSRTVEKCKSPVAVLNFCLKLNPENNLNFFLPRSPSPEPVYSNDGKRMNTREFRKRRELEESRHDAVQVSQL